LGNCFLNMFLNMVDTLRRGGSQPNSQSAARPSAAEDSSTVHPTVCGRRRNL